ncbi:MULTISPECIES: PAS domain-containing sensor histidine kinase [Legionella]|uniref:histidine kinase n=1 Tax=Legionella resiliens TaxID=2905958 RepID=A0ABS8X9D3_9GAMM|nr:MULTISPECIES: PAS domain S-box protein [unclassified Legionella]MCE0724507.1 PAS domain S-box protein [Legionella sp. 9fVS26]MCE3533660.1 PAS domain S-box protein [Legionella sp. 8cVS16]QLZ69851.1 Adaptive-response sensory-kinase SasA [Legionella sp. PC1000]
MKINRNPTAKDIFYAAIIESSNDAIVGKDLKGTIISWNKAAENLYGYTAKEIIGLSIDYLIPTDRKYEIQQILTKIKEGKKIDHYETVRLKRDGTEIKVSISVSPIKDDSGKVIGAASIIREIPFVTPEQKKFELAVEAAPNGMLVIDVQGNIRLVNEQIEKMFGYTRSELLGKPIEVLVPARYRENHPQYREDFFKDPKARLMGAGRDLYGLRQDGTEFPVEIGLNPLQTDEGVLVFASVVDITERKRLTQRFELAVEASPTGMIMINRAGEIELLNSQIIKMFGYEKHELMGKKIEILVPERFRAKHPEHRLVFFENPKARLMGAGRDLFGQRKDGTEFPVEIGLNPLITEDGSFVLASVVDITERKKEQEKFRLAIESTPAGILMVNKMGEIELANRQVLKMFKYKKEDLIGQKIEALIPIRFRANHPKYRMAYFMKPQTRAMGTSRDLYGLRSDDTEFPVEIGLNPLKTESGIFVLASIIDITERKNNEQMIKRSNAELERFAYIVSHDLKAPLRGIATISEWIIEEYKQKLDSKGRNYLELLDNRVKKLQALIDGILEYSRIGHVQGEPERINLNKLIEEVKEVLMPPKHIKIKIQQDLPVIYAEKIHIYQIIQNLISNAIIYNDKKQGLIEIGVSEHSKEWKFFVKDNGIGIDEQYKDKVFELFQTLQSKEKYSSTGIGLSLAKKILELYGGKIWFNSIVGQETTFYFTLNKEKVSAG